MSISPETLERYTATAQARAQDRQKKRAERYRRAWELARKAAHLLQEEFGATQVMAFGSLAHEDRFTLWSDIDLAVWGLADADYFSAVARLQDLDRDISIDLVAIPYCQPAMIEQIRREGVPL